MRRSLRIALSLVLVCALPHPFGWAAAPALQSAQLRGALLDSQGLPAEGYQVALKTKGGDLFLSAPTGADGAFVLEGLPPNTYRLTAFSPDGTEFPVLAREVSLSPGQVERIEIRISAKGAPPGRTAKTVGKGGGRPGAHSPKGAAAPGGGSGVSTGIVIGVCVAGAFALAAVLAADDDEPPPASPAAPR